MNVIGKECLHDCEADLSAAFREVIAAIAGGCVNCAARREAIPEAMRFISVFYGGFGPC